ncbi:MAG: N-carbamoyl-D-amino-acid hydrolase [Rhodospirillaceae bacterium]|jgi:N-carbamoyl-D-amino-acid hydrolase|nr:N-carbamoyl-D-amino-acid hydrolase [Rhodospirillaceae bacterium]MBT5524473.1 N-carbamoyl-D-amino-acid hydrolase [Rhodospirillaceae bacterium]MBT5881661.1 N-carbamoyl-D-amino-acid hydrolase [Rhodospirillaceae bacterium]MBT6590358.1 N-carbamoyl-D-amino-acid hydrolase [Rhodospirillaceae bacterium]MBT6912390.1 N-carbamoyl-D-amino-acid hydrolase [Rhodospirillaceae bacterium]
MTRLITVAAAQLGPIEREESKTSVVKRMTDMMRHAHSRGARLVVFPEMALTTFFPRWYIEDEAELDAFYETEMPSNETQPLFDLSKQLGVGFYLGYSEMFFDDTGKKRRFNTAILVNQQAEIVGKYRKVHLPGHATYEPEREWQHLEKGYFEVGDLGFPVFRTMGGVMGMCLCNDRRWPETWRVMGMQDVDIVMLGYNTPVYNSIAPESPHLRMFHNHISMQAGAYQNGTWAVGTAKAGMEGGVDMMAGSCIIAPTGEIVALATTSEDEVIVAECDLDKGRYIRDTVFNFAQHRRIENYGVITERTEAIAPPE